MEGRSEWLQLLTHPNAAPASVISRTYCQAPEYSGECKSPKAQAVINIPATFPRSRESKGWMKPRKTISSNTGPTTTAKMPNNITQPGVDINRSKGDLTWGVCSAAP